MCVSGSQVFFSEINLLRNEKLYRVTTIMLSLHKIYNRNKWGIIFMYNKRDRIKKYEVLLKLY